jgi:hypothetical protein
MGTIEFKVNNPCKIITPEQYQEYYYNVLKQNNLTIKSHEMELNPENNSLIYKYEVSGKLCNMRPPKILASFNKYKGKTLVNEREGKVVGVVNYFPDSIKTKFFS